MISGKVTQKVSEIGNTPYWEFSGKFYNGSLPEPLRGEGGVTGHVNIVRCAIEVVHCQCCSHSKSYRWADDGSFLSPPEAELVEQQKIIKIAQSCRIPPYENWSGVWHKDS